MMNEKISILSEVPGETPPPDNAPVKFNWDDVKWTDKMKKKAVKMYLQSGSLALVSRQLKIPYNTLISWKHKTAWWKQVVEDFREENDLQLAAKMEKITEKALKGIEKRIDDGEQILDSKTGTVVNVPVKTRDLTTAVKVLSDRQDVLIGRAKKESEDKESQADKLAKLAAEFAAFNKIKQEKTIDGEVLSSEITKDTNG